MRRPALAVSLYVRDRACVVVGEGAIAEERAARLRDAGAIVRVIAPAAYDASVCTGATMVLCCDEALMERASADARAAGALAYALDWPEQSDLALPAIARRGPVQLAISTDGVAPALARQLREELQRALDAAGPAIDRLLDEMEATRAALPAGPERKAHLRAIAERLELGGSFVVRGD